MTEEHRDAPASGAGLPTKENRVITCLNNKVHDAVAVEKIQCKYGNLGGYGGHEHFVTISLDGAFENKSLCYEDWCVVWTVSLHAITKERDWRGRWSRLEKPIVAQNRCLYCALEKVLAKARIEEAKIIDS